jgi:hypothetical protein
MPEDEATMPTLILTLILVYAVFFALIHVIAGRRQR